MECSFSFSGGPLESRAGWDLCEPILRKLISIKLLPNWHTGFMTTLYLHTIEFRYLHSDIRSNTFAFRNFKYDQTLCKLILKERPRGEGEVRMYSFFVVWKQVEGMVCSPMLTNASITKPPVCCFCPLCLTAVPTTNSWQQTNVQICNSKLHNEPRLHHTGKCICTYTGNCICIILASVFAPTLASPYKHSNINLSNATAYTQSSHI